MMNSEMGFPSEKAVVDKLKTALGLVETLKQENQAYKENFDHVREPHFALTECVS